jgi:hypothetical protein
MNNLLQFTIPLLLSLSLGYAQQEVGNRDSDRFAVTVLEVKGKCVVWDGKAMKKNLRVNDKLQAEQKMQCEGSARIRFSNSGAEKEIKTNAPNCMLFRTFRAQP